MASKNTDPTASDASAEAPVFTGPYAKYVGHRVRMRRGGAFVKMMPPDEHSTTTAFGTDFPRGFWVPIGHLDPMHQKKLAGNPGFVTAEEPAAKEPVVAPEDMVVGPTHRMGLSGDESLPVYDSEAEYRQAKAAGELDT